MTQSNILSREQAVYLGLETAFGVIPSGSFPNAMTRAYPLHDDVKVDGLAQEMLDVNDVRVRRDDAIVPIHGLKLPSKVALKSYLKAVPAAGLLTAAGVAVSAVERVLLTHALGGEFAGIGAAGINAGSSTTVVVTADGTKFHPGTWIAVPVSASAVEVTKVLSKAVDTLTVDPPLSAAVFDGGAVRNLYNYCPAESHSSSIAMELGFVGDTAAQYSATGVHGNLTWDFPEFGKLPTMSFAGDAVSFTGPTVAGYAVTSASDPMGAAIPFRPAVYLAAPGSIARGTRLVCEKIALEHNVTWEMVREPGATTTETVNSVVDTAGRPQSAKLTLTTRFDLAWDTAFLADTVYQFVAILPTGSGLTQSFWVWEVSRCTIAMKPKLVKIGERLGMELVFNAQIDQACTADASTAAAVDRADAPFRVAFG